MNFVFVYGTLKQGHGNNRVLTQHRARFVCTALTSHPFRMWRGGFPMIVPATNPTADDMPFVGHVRGEVWNVTTERGMEAFDMLEGNGYMYRRQLMAVRPLNGGAPMFTQGYVWLRPTGSLEAVRPFGGILEWGGMPAAMRRVA